MSKRQAKKAAPEKNQEAQDAQEVQENKQTLTVDGRAYDVGQLSDEARQLVVNVQAADQELHELNRKLAITQTARVTYLNALNEVLPQPIEAQEAPKEAAAKKK